MTARDKQNPCTNPEPHAAGSLPCCAGIIFRGMEQRPHPIGKDERAKELRELHQSCKNLDHALDLDVNLTHKHFWNDLAAYTTEAEKRAELKGRAIAFSDFETELGNTIPNYFRRYGLEEKLDFTELEQAVVSAAKRALLKE